MGFWKDVIGGYQSTRYSGGDNRRAWPWDAALEPPYASGAPQWSRDADWSGTIHPAPQPAPPPMPPPGPPPSDTSRLVANLTKRIQEIEAENAELRDTLAHYVGQIALRNAEVEGYRWESNESARVIANLSATLAERDAKLAEVTAIKDRFKAKGRQLLGEVAEWRSHADAIRKCAGGWKAMSKATHPDTAAPDDRAARAEIFKLVQFIFKAR